MNCPKCNKPLQQVMFNLGFVGEIAENGNSYVCTNADCEDGRRNLPDTNDRLKENK